MPQNKTPALHTRRPTAIAMICSACLALGAVSAQATPKAAEHENAPVTFGAEVARPQVSSKPAKPHVIGKKKADAKKERHDAKPAKKVRSKK